MIRAGKHDPIFFIGVSPRVMIMVGWLSGILCGLQFFNANPPYIERFS